MEGKSIQSKISTFFFQFVKKYFEEIHKFGDVMLLKYHE